MQNRKEEIDFKFGIQLNMIQFKLKTFEKMLNDFEKIMFFVEFHIIHNNVLFEYNRHFSSISALSSEITQGLAHYRVVSCLSSTYDMVEAHNSCPCPHSYFMQNLSSSFNNINLKKSPQNSVLKCWCLLSTVQVI